jgi:hypothetical protein
VSRSGFRGVHRHGRHGFRAVIFENGRQVHLGSYPDKESASAAYALAAKRRALQKLAQAQARAGDAQEVAKRVIDLIQATIALSREQTDHEAALQRIHIAAKIVTGAIPPDMYANASVTERSAAAR